jgi:hypothetical protein
MSERSAPHTPLSQSQRARRRWLRRAALALAALLLAVLAIAGIQVAPMLFERDAYAGVTSIEANAAYRDPALLARAWQLPVATRYRAHPYEFQHNQSFCGPTSVADVLHSLGDGRSQDAMLAGTPYPMWFGYLPGGLTLDQLADLLHRRTGRPVAVARGQSLALFRAAMRGANDPIERVIVNFHRGPMFGRGHGHFSPVLGYLADRDLVLLGDVNPDYRPYLVPTERLWRAATTIDAASGKPRGLAIVAVPG